VRKFYARQLDPSEALLGSLDFATYRMRCAMPSLVSLLHDAAVSPEALPQALDALTDAVGAAGAALIISNKSTGSFDEAYFSGLSAGFRVDYIRHYTGVDPYSPLLDASWTKLSECLRAPCYGRANGTTISY
jgi:hypothetical protein